MDGRLSGLVRKISGPTANDNETDHMKEFPCIVCMPAATNVMLCITNLTKQGVAQMGIGHRNDHPRGHLVIQYNISQ